MNHQLQPPQFPLRWIFQVLTVLSLIGALFKLHQWLGSFVFALAAALQSSLGMMLFVIILFAWRDHDRRHDGYVYLWLEPYDYRIVRVLCWVQLILAVYILTAAMFFLEVS